MGGPPPEEGADGARQGAPHLLSGAQQWAASTPGHLCPSPTGAQAQGSQVLGSRRRSIAGGCATSDGPDSTFPSGVGTHPGFSPGRPSPGHPLPVLPGPGLQAASPQGPASGPASMLFRCGEAFCTQSLLILPFHQMPPALRTPPRACPHSPLPSSCRSLLPMPTSP